MDNKIPTLWDEIEALLDNNQTLEDMDVHEALEDFDENFWEEALDDPVSPINPINQDSEMDLEIIHEWSNLYEDPIDQCLKAFTPEPKFLWDEIEALVDIDQTLEDFDEIFLEEDYEAFDEPVSPIHDTDEVGIEGEIIKEWSNLHED